MSEEQVFMQHEKGTGPFSGNRRESRVELLGISHRQALDLHAQRPSRCLHCIQHSDQSGIVGIPEHSYPGNLRRDLFE